MARKKSRAQYTSKGHRRSVSKWVTKAMKKDVPPLVRLRRQREAFNRGKNVMLTIPNPNKQETREPFIRINAKEVWRKSTPFMMKQSDG